MNPKGASDCIRPERIYGVVRHPENAYLEAFYRQPIWEPLHRRLRRIRSPPVSFHFHTASREQTVKVCLYRIKRHERLSPRGKVVLANAEAPIWVAHAMPPNRQVRTDGWLNLTVPSYCNSKMLSGTFESFRILSDSFGSFRVLSGPFGSFWCLSDAFGSFRVLSGPFGFSCTA